jgi:hypothetical protein
MSGCVFFTPQATLIQYDPSDGVSATVGDVDFRNVVGIINEDGHAISLMMTLVNTGDKRANVNIQFESGGEKKTVTESVQRGSTVSFGTGGDTEQIIVLNPSVGAGELLPVYVQYGDHEGAEMLVPVLDATGDYAELAPPEIER